MIKDFKFNKTRKIYVGSGEYFTFFEIFEYIKYVNTAASKEIRRYIKWN